MRSGLPGLLARGQRQVVPLPGHETTLEIQYLRESCLDEYSADDPLLDKCDALAYIYWQAVMRFGGLFFDPCRCEPDKCATARRCLNQM